MVTITSLATQLAREMIASPAPPAFKADYASFYNEWLLFRLNNKGWFSRASSSVYEKTMEYKVRLKDWQEKFIKLGFKTNISVIRSESNWPLRTLAIAGGVTLGVYFFAKIMVKRYVVNRYNKY